MEDKREMHPRTLFGRRPQTAAEAAGNMEYGALREFLVALANKLEIDSITGKSRRRPKLAQHLHKASVDIFNASKEVEAGGRTEKK